MCGIKNAVFDAVDFHAHILPGADHGCASVADLLVQLDIALRYGVSRIVATPHFYPQSFSVEEFLYKREVAYRAFCDATEGRSLPSVICGAEVLMCENIENMPDIEKLCIGKSNVLLLELPQNSYAFKPDRSVRRLIDKGFDIVLAHADRYDSQRIDELVSIGAKIQLNAPSLSSIIVKKHILNWINSGSVVCIGSDIHGTSPVHYRKFNKAAGKIARCYSELRDSSDALWRKVSF